jgi:oxygen-independent coproporphyrinogen-3 oxidase
MNLALYIHWPYCISKCPYCDFNSHVGDTQDQDKWRKAYQRELEYYAALLSERTVTSIFFGGGTPSLMEARTVESILQNVARLWRIDDKAEITLEANPSSVEADKFRDFQIAGVNRLSLGVQSLNEDALKFLGRAHNVDEAKKAITLASQVFKRFSFDLIYARQNQAPEMWREELQRALALAGEHLSLYQLTIEPHTQFDTRTRHGEHLTAVDDHAVMMYEMTQDIMDEAGLPAYEISNHARGGQESRHNLTYWHYEDYIGIGPGAHGRTLIKQVRHAIENHRAPDIWLQQTSRQGHGIKSDDIIDYKTAMREALMMGLRLSEGIDLANWREKFQMSLLDFLGREKIERLTAEGYIIENAKTLGASRTGLQRLNALLGYLE